MDTTETFLKRHQTLASVHAASRDANEPEDDRDDDLIPPMVYRIYKSTVQRQTPSYHSLSSFAAFLILLDNESQVLGWIGSQCSEEDSTLLQELGIEVSLIRFYLFWSSLSLFLFSR
jgi:hypothetical protein